MQVRTAASSLLLAASLLLPTAAFASLSSVANQLVVTTNASSYRLKTTGLWQLSTLAAGTISQEINVNGIKYLVVGNTELYRSTGGLLYEHISLPINTSSIILKNTENRLFVLADNNSSLSTFEVNEDGSTVNYLPIAQTTASQVSSIIKTNNKIVMLVSNASGLASYVLQASVWQLEATFSCTGPAIFYSPIIAIFCPSEQQLYERNSFSWELAGSFSYIASDQLLVGTLLGQSKILITDGTLELQQSYDSGQVGSVNGVMVYGKRIFIRASHLYELDWSAAGNLVLMDADPNAAVVSEQGSQAIYIAGSLVSYSEGINNLSPVTVPGLFDRAMQLINGDHLVWKKSGSLTAYATLGSATYNIVPTTWAKSSQLTDVLQWENKTYALLINGSGNYNLYLTNTFDKWSRITLPTKATNVVSVQAARQLPVGSLLETTGIITARRGIVASNILYIQDDLSGIQAYLSTSKGTLPDIEKKRVVITGEVSESQAKRVILDDLSAISVIGDDSISPESINLDSLSNYLGRLVVFRTKISGITSDYFMAGNVKVHGKLNIEMRQSDLVEATVVVDYNSSSGANEAWLTSSPTLIEQAPSADEQGAQAVDGANSAQISQRVVVTRDVSAIDTGAQVEQLVLSATSDDQATTPLVAAISTPEASDEPLDRSIQTTALLSLLSFLGGVLAISGGRFRKVD